MAENEKVVETVAEEEAVQTPKAEANAKSSESFGAKVKEWFRKFTVKLKRQTQLIPLVVILITSLVYMVCVGTYSQVVQYNTGIKASGISLFVNTLLSILIFPTFLNAFPKRKKANKVFIAAVFVILAAILAMDLLFYLMTNTYVNSYDDPEAFLAVRVEIPKAFTQLIVHMVFVGISIVVFALLPVYKKAINKINTRKELAENKLSGEIDTSAEV